MSSNAPARTRPLANRLLFPALPADAPLPPLVSSPELTAELYELIALSLRAFVVPWWSKLSRYDRQFLPEITNVLTVVVHALDARRRALDIPRLLFLRLPPILTQHYRDYRNAQAKLASSYASGGAASLPHLFHQLQPHMAISPDGHLDVEYFRQLLDHVLSVCLPSQDYLPDAERFIVREVALNVLLNEIVPKITRPWFIQQCILDLLQLQDQLPEPPRSISKTASTSSFSFHNIIILVLSIIQTLSTACLTLIHAYKQTLNTIRNVNGSPSSPSSPPNYTKPPLTMLSEIFTFQDRATSTIILTIVRLITESSASFLDKLLPHLLAIQLSPTFILSTTRTAKRTLFPNGYPGPPSIEPTPEEQAEIRARLVASRPNGALANRLLPLILGPSPSKTLEAALDPFSNIPCNAHLVLFLFDLLLLELFPELALPPSVADGKEEYDRANTQYLD